MECPRGGDARAGLSQVIKPMSIEATSGQESHGTDVEPRTRRACVESMTVVPHSDGTGMFDVYSGESAEPYVVDLAGEHDRCTCEDMEYNLEDGERCKHSRRVRMEFGLVPFEDVPPVRSEHSAPTDVELARKRRGLDAGVDVEPEPEPKPITVGDAKSARAVATDGGVVLEPETRGESVEDTDVPDLSADATVNLHGIVAETTSATKDLPDFDVYCVAVEFSTQHIRRLLQEEVTD